MWKRVYIVMFPHFKDKVLFSLGQKCGNVSIYSDVSSFKNMVLFSLEQKCGNMSI